MSLQQSTLPFKQQSEKNFQQFIGNHSVIDTLLHPEKLPSFVFILGEGFSGKTHVLKALENTLNEQDDVCFAVEAKQLTDIDLSQILPLNIKFLLVDNIHELAGHQQAEVALFNLFNHCKANGIKLVVTSVIHSKSSQWQLPDLISRMNSGLTLKLEVLRGAEALKCFADQFSLNGIPLDISVLHYLQTHHSSTYDDLYQLFIQVSVESLKLKRRVTVPLVKQVVGAQNKSSFTENSEL